MNAAPRPRREEHLTLAALRTAVGCARLLVRSNLPKWGIGREHVETAELLVTELVTNAVKSTGIIEPYPSYGEVYDDLALIGLRLRLMECSLVIEVWDSSLEPPTPKAQYLDAESGRGLFLVASLSSRWGYYLTRHGGKVVWCELTLAHPTMDDTMRLPRILPQRKRGSFAFPQPARPIGEMRDPETLKRVLDGLQQIDGVQEKER